MEKVTGSDELKQGTHVVVPIPRPVEVMEAAREAVALKEEEVSHCPPPHSC